MATAFEQAIAAEMRAVGADAVVITYYNNGLEIRTTTVETVEANDRRNLTDWNDPYGTQKPIL